MAIETQNIYECNGCGMKRHQDKVQDNWVSFAPQGEESETLLSFSGNGDWKEITTLLNGDGLHFHNVYCLTRYLKTRMGLDKDKKSEGESESEPEE